MTGQQFAKYIRKQTKTDATTYTDDELLTDANAVLDEMVASIAQVDEDYFGMLSYRNIVAGQREYSLPEKILNNTKYFEVDLKGDNPGDPNNTAAKYIRCAEFDLTQYKRSTDERYIRENFQFGPPVFDIFRSALWIYSGDEIIKVKDGLKLFHIMFPDPLKVSDLSNNNRDLSNNLTVPYSAGVPRQFHKVWATKVIVLFKTSKEKPIPLTQDEKSVDGQFATMLSAISGLNLDRSQCATMPTYDWGQNY